MIVNRHLSKTIFLPFGISGDIIIYFYTHHLTTLHTLANPPP